MAPSKQMEIFEESRFTMEMNFDSDGTMESDQFDAYEVFDMIRYINDPEHPNTLE